MRELRFRLSGHHRQIAPGIQVRCYTCTKTATVPGIILGEVDFFADAKAKVDQILERVKAKAPATPSPKR